jgi:hypothetical protein
MLREDRFQLPDFFAQPLALRKCAFQSGSEIAVILHKSSICSSGTPSGVFWVDYREPLSSGNLTKYRICRDKMIHQLLIPQFQRHRDTGYKRHSSIRFATRAVQPVWWLAPRPAPLSP